VFLKVPAAASIFRVEEPEKLLISTRQHRFAVQRAVIFIQTTMKTSP
jgi:hypothetical protein